VGDGLVEALRLVTLGGLGLVTDVGRALLDAAVQGTSSLVGSLSGAPNAPGPTTWPGAGPPLGTAGGPGSSPGDGGPGDGGPDDGGPDDGGGPPPPGGPPDDPPDDPPEDEPEEDECEQ